MRSRSGPRLRRIRHARFTVAAGRRLANAKDWAKPFRARLLEPGLVSYEDSNNGKVLLRKETIDRDIGSFVGRPLVVKQNRRGVMVHAVATPANMKEIGHGYVTDVFYNDADGWWWCRGLADTDEAVAAIERVGKCSCAYGVTRIGPPDPKGWHDIPYNEEILGFSGEHLAVVDNPRYEEAHILLNSKNPTGANMSFLKMFKKTAAAAPVVDDAAEKAAKVAADAAAEAARIENSKGESITAETTFTLPAAEGADAETVSLGQLVDDHAAVGEFRTAIENAKKNGIEVEEGDEICYNGKKMRMSNAFVEAFDKWSKTNATDDDKKDGDKKENAKADAPVADGGPETAEQVAAREDAARAEAARKVNSKGGHFNVLLSARDVAPPPAAKHTLNTLAERLENGRNMYGTKKTT